MMLCRQIPKLFAGVLGGAPTLTGGDFAATLGALASAALAAGSAMAGAGMLVGGGMLASRAAGASVASGSSSMPGASSAVASVGAAKGTKRWNGGCCPSEFAI